MLVVLEPWSEAHISNMKLSPSINSAFTLVEIMIVVSMVGLLATIGVPNYLRAATTSRRSECISNLRQLDSAVQQFILENKRAANSAVSLEDCTPYIRNSMLCPTGGKTIADSYSVTDGQTVPACIAIGGGAASGHLMVRKSVCRIYGSP